jgi:hypothetical protein
MFNESSFPELTRIISKKFNKENLMHYLLVISAHRLAFVSSIDANENLKTIAKDNSLKGDVITGEPKSIILLEKKKLSFLDKFFKNLFDNIHTLDSLLYVDFDANIHRLKVIGNRLLPLIEVLKIRELDGVKTRIEDFLLIMDVIKGYLPDYDFKDVSFDDIKKLDKRKRLKPLTNNEKLIALCEFCPELITLLNKSKLTKDEKGQVIYLITDVNKEDAYKKVFTADNRTLDKTTITNKEIDFEDLKNKLKNT